jgi:hypothetical protein
MIGFILPVLTVTEKSLLQIGQLLLAWNHVAIHGW